MQVSAPPVGVLPAKSMLPSAPCSPLSRASNASSSGQVLWGLPEPSTADQDLDDSQFFCDENVQEQRAPPQQAHSRPASGQAASSSAAAASQASYGWRVTAADELSEMIRRELARERELPRSAGYLARADAQHGGEFVTPQMRSIVTSWLSEVAGEFGMQQETLFLAVALLDRFQACSPSGVPRNVLQLVAVACMMVASKQDEVSHPTVDEFTEIAADAFKREDLLRMERLLLDQLEWRVQLPTTYVFLHLFTQALAGRLAPAAIALSAYLAELSLLDYAMLEHPPSLVAAAALAAGAAWHGGAAGAVEEVTGYSTASLGQCAAQLLHLHQCASAAECVAAYQPLAYVREKYSQDHWLAISRHQPSASAAAALGLPRAAPEVLQQQEAARA
ncbi:MAG: cyclin-like protein [Monoraphidium minutum]|nr:MAG: cyclin-like protein [Monoraphidium minutum]